MAILESTDEALPPRYRLDSLVNHLASQQNRRILIGVVEAWAQSESPSANARMAQGRALLELGQCDSAWARLQELAESDEATVELLLLTAEIFMARRWPKKARTVLERARVLAPDTPRIKHMLDALAESQTVPEPCDYDDPHQLTVAAHHCLATGAVIRGKSLLNQIVQSFPNQDRAQDMLWALDGDLGLECTLSEAIDRYGPDLGALADLGEEADMTESATQIDRVPIPEREAPFPDLFRDLERQTEVYEPTSEFTDEVTHVTSMAELPPVDHPGEQTDVEEQTQIQHVILKQEDRTGPTTPSTSVFSADYDVPETEDADVVRLTRGDITEDQPLGPESDLPPLDLEITATDPRATELDMEDEPSWVKPPEPSPRAPQRPTSFATDHSANIVGVAIGATAATIMVVLLAAWLWLG